MKKRLPMTSLTSRWPRATRLAVVIVCAFLGSGCATSLYPKFGTEPAPALRLLRTPAVVVDAMPVPVPAASAVLTAPTAPAAPAEPAAVLAAALPLPVPVDPLRPEVKVDLDSQQSHADLWIRVRRGFAMPDLDTDLVREREQWYASRPDYVARMTERGGRYLFHIVEELERRKMPTELALLPFIESAFNPQAMSSAKASGMWQFIPSTGKHFSLKQNIFRDDRRDVLASTRAALDYLGKLHDMFGDWHLALAAYNWGEGSVARAIAKNQKAGLPTDYQSLNMPNETRHYLPKLQAVKNIIARPEAFALTLPALRNHPYFLSVPIDRDIDVAIAAKLAGLPVDEFKTLNPQMNKPVILAAGTPQVLLPYDNANQFLHRLAQYRGPLATWTAWVAPKTLRPADAARQVGMSEANLRDVNRIPPRMLVKVGSTLLVPRGEHRQADVSEQLADNAMISLAPDLPPMRKLAFKAGKRDTVATIARRYKLSVAQVAHLNKVAAGASFKRGQTVVVMVPVKAARTAKVGKVGKAGTRMAALAKGRGKGTRVVARSAVTKVVAKAPARGKHTAVKGKPLRVAQR